MPPTSVEKRSFMVSYKEVWNKASPPPEQYVDNFRRSGEAEADWDLPWPMARSALLRPAFIFYIFLLFLLLIVLSLSLSPFLKRMTEVELHLPIRIRQLLLLRLFFCCCFCRCCFCCFSRWCWFSCWSTFLCFFHWFCCGRSWCCRGISGWGGGVTTLYRHYYLSGTHSFRLEAYYFRIQNASSQLPGFFLCSQQDVPHVLSSIFGPIFRFFKTSSIVSPLTPINYQIFRSMVSGKIVLVVIASKAI